MDVDERLIHETSGLCKVCKNAIDVRVVARPDGEVWMRKACAAHGPQDVRISTDAAWYEATRKTERTKIPPRTTPKEVHHGCPFDCGACTSHEQKVRLPVVTITSACNLDCPICYVHNKNDGAFHMTAGDFDKVLAHLKEEHQGEIDIINLTGGEPTVHPQFLELLERAKDAGIHRVTICTNGIRLARDEGLVKRLAELGARVALSFDTFEKEADFALQGAKLFDLKMKCLDLLEKHGVDTTLIPVMTRAVNEHEIGKIIDLAVRRSNVRHIEVHTITYTGQGGVDFPRSGRISMVEVLEEIERTTGGVLRKDDFVSSPCAHPLCYQIAYLLVDPEGGAPISFSRFVPKATIYECLSERLYIEPTRKLEEAMTDAIDRLWAVDGDAEAERALRILRKLLGDMFPKDRSITREEALRVSERASKAIYIHSHMDEETFDTERIVECCDSNCYADGTTIPVCSYNVLYREKEDHFMLQPVTWSERSGGRKKFPGSLPIVR
jgi:uncharacterized radical SAM superfamily Fe-S cluster-containing enzyme